MKCKTLGKTIRVPEEVTNGDPNIQEVTIKQNFSLHSAFLQTATDTYNIAHFFLALGRSLRRRRSEEAGVISTVPGGMPLSAGCGALVDDGARPVARRARAKTVVADAASSSGAAGDADEPQADEGDAEEKDELPPSPT